MGIEESGGGFILLWGLRGLELQSLTWGDVKEDEEEFQCECHQGCHCDGPDEACLLYTSDAADE